MRLPPRAVPKLRQIMARLTGDCDCRWHSNTSISALHELLNVLLGCQDQLAGPELGRNSEERQRQSSRPDFTRLRHPSADVEKKALSDPKIQGTIGAKQIVKVIVVPDKLVNIVIK